MPRESSDRHRSAHDGELHGHDRICRARTVSRPARRRARGHLLAWRSALRDADRRAALSRDEKPRLWCGRCSRARRRMSSTVVPSVPPPLDDLLARALSRDPARRPQTVRRVSRGASRPLAHWHRPDRAAHVRSRVARSDAGGRGRRCGALRWSSHWYRRCVRRPEPSAGEPVIAVMPLTNASGDSTQGLPRARRRRQPHHAAGRAAVGHRAVAVGGGGRPEPRAQTCPHSRPSSTRPIWLTAACSRSATSSASISIWCATMPRWPGPRQSREVSTKSSSCRRGWPPSLAEALQVQLSAADRASSGAAADAELRRAGRLLARPRAVGAPRCQGQYRRRRCAAFDEAVATRPAICGRARGARRGVMGALSRDRRSRGSRTAAIEAGTTALRLDPEPAERPVLAGAVAGGQWPAGRCVEELQRALALQPNYDDARGELGSVLARQGKNRRGCGRTAEGDCPPTQVSGATTARSDCGCTRRRATTRRLRRFRASSNCNPTTSSAISNSGRCTRLSGRRRRSIGKLPARDRRFARPPQRTPISGRCTTAAASTPRRSRHTAQPSSFGRTAPARMAIWAMPFGVRAGGGRADRCTAKRSAW